MAIDLATSERARRALSHGGGIDGIIFMLMSAAGIGLVVILLVVAMQRAEFRATQATGETSDRPQTVESTEIGEE